MRISLAPRTIRAGVALTAAAGLVSFLAPAPAQADVLPIQIAAAGSDTTQALMDQILNGANQYNIHSLDVTETFTVSVPADDRCGAVTYQSPSPASGSNVLAPQGSSAGRNALRDSAVNGTYPTAALGAGKGCIDIARSSAEPRAVGATADAASFEYYALALDQVTWASPSLSAPASLTQQQVKDIFACRITNWAQLPGGGAGQIKRFVPSATSGTGATFINKVLGGTAPAAARAIDTATFGPQDLGCPAAVTVVENHGDDPALLGADYQTAIMEYSAGKWNFQANNSANPTLDIRKGTRLGGFSTPNSAAGLNPSDPITWNPSSVTVHPVVWNGVSKQFFLNSAVVNEANENSPTPTYPGVRFLFNVIDNTSPSYTTARGLVGFDNTGGGTAKSPLCSGTKNSVILSQGFLPIAAATQNGNPSVTCRFKQPV